MRKIVVYSRNTNVKIEDGGIILPISDDNWVAYSYSRWDIIFFIDKWWNSSFIFFIFLNGYVYKDL